MNPVANVADSYKSNAVPFALLRMAKDMELGEAKEKNFVFSPCSIQLALSLLAAGANGETLKELLSYLEFENLDHLKLVNRKQVGMLTPTTTKGGPDLSFVGGALIDQSCTIKQNFKIDAERIYRVKFESVDFKDDIKREKVIVAVNEWCKEATKGLINSILPEGSLSLYTKSVFANALFFKGVWKEKFDESLTKEGKFRLRDGNVQVPYMRSFNDQFIDSYDDLQVLRLRYENSTISMYILLPKRSKTGGLYNLVEKVGSDPKVLEQYISRDIEYVRVGKFMLPKFKITYDFKAKELLKSTGGKLLFSDEAELSELVDLQSDKRLCVNQMYHKSYIEVDEEGTEAAAVTLDEEFEICLFDPTPLPPPVDFVADHAFIFVLRDDKSEMVLFMGHVINPLLD